MNKLLYVINSLTIDKSRVNDYSDGWYYKLLRTNICIGFIAGRGNKRLIVFGKVSKCSLIIVDTLMLFNSAHKTDINKSNNETEKLSASDFDILIVPTIKSVFIICIVKMSRMK